MTISEEINRLADQIEEVIKSDQFLIGSHHSAKRLKFLATNSLIRGSYAREKAREIANYAEDFAKHTADKNLILAKIKDRLSRIRAEAKKFAHQQDNA